MPGPAVAGPWCDDTRGLNRAGCPSSVLSCTAWGFSCLANCFASGELLPRLFTLACLRNGRLSASPTSQRTGGVFSVTLSVNIRFPEYCPRILRGMLPYGVRTFLQQSRQRATHQRSSAIGREFSTKNPNLEARKPRMLRLMLDVEVGHAVLCAPRSLGIGVHGVPAVPIPSL
jgi:hypothetical protein